MKYFLPLIFLFLFSVHRSSATTIPVAKEILCSIDTTQLNKIVLQFEHDSTNTGLKRGKKENKKLIAAILAFPVPFGFLGLHRIYLGTEPWIPVVYTATLGGGMLLPLLDFIAIVCADKDELKAMQNNPKLFMWVN
jgi:TM2 domain-containing membrane protein YozV